MTFVTDQRLLLEAVREAAPAGIRAVQAGGPGFAKDCHMVAVHPELMADPHLNPAGRRTEIPGGHCAAMAKPGYRVVYVKDCYPTFDAESRRPRVPPADEITAWTEEYLGEWEAIYEAILKVTSDGYVPAALAGAEPLGGPEGCQAVTVGAAQFTGPLGGMAWVSVPIVVAAAGPYS